jgi:hypothetical protein
MNHWAHMLQELPTGLQQLIARTQRVSLPRACSSAERHARLRAALCSAATVRATYATLDPAIQAALQDLRARRGGVNPDELERLYGPVRSITAMRADPIPQTIAERLILLGWLLPRPTKPRHPAHYLLPPELRRRLPSPFQPAPFGAAPPAPPPPALHTVALLILTCAERPLACRADGHLRRNSLRLLAARLGEAEEAVAPLLTFLMPLLESLGLLACRHGRCVLAPAGSRWLTLTPDAQLERLRDAWIAHPPPDAWLRAVVTDVRGIDWPLLRRRLIHWAEALPMDVRLDPATLAPALASTFGPLADAWTHGFRRVNRAPWQPRRAAAVFDAALAGPLQWLGYVTVRGQGSAVRGQGPADGEARTGKREQGTGVKQRPSSVVRRPSSVVGQDMWIQRSSQPTQSCPAPWSYGAAGELHVPITSADIDLVRALPMLQWVRTAGDRLIYRATPARLARAQAQGHSISAIWDIIARRAGPIPVPWRAALSTAPEPLRLTHAVVLTGDPPQLTRAAQSRSMRRYIDHQLAPGVAVVRSDRVAALERALARQGMGVIGDTLLCARAGSCTLGSQKQTSSLELPDLHPGDTAALLAACAFYRRAAPADVPLYLDELVEQRLRAALPSALRVATDQAIAAFTPPSQGTGDGGWEDGETRRPGDGETRRPGDGETRRPGDGEQKTGSRGQRLPIRRQSSVVGGRWSVVGRRSSVVENRVITTPACDSIRQGLRRAIDRQDVVTIAYDRGGQGDWSTRTVRPLALEQQADVWYLRAYCLLRNAERTFRVDRIGDQRSNSAVPRQGS